jgi:hypothetical protein
MDVPFLKACVLFSMWLRKRSGMVLGVVHVLFVGMRRITLPQGSFVPTCFDPVSCSSE